MTDSVVSRRVALASVGGMALAVCLGCANQSTATTGPVTVAASDIPVGSGKIVGTFVVTQPQAGTFVAFSYLCTHQGLPVQQVTSAAIVCGRHGSSFSLTDGSVVTGPAAKALTPATVTRSGDTLTIS
jgi:nitrite reductase/ring-hydroxylating ferredoxin subunit